MFASNLKVSLCINIIFLNMPELVYFDPSEYVRGLQQLLISDSKRIGFLFGAGTSCAIKEGASEKSIVPGIVRMTREITDSVSSQSKEFKNAIIKIQNELRTNKMDFTIENLLSVITQKHAVVGNETLCGLDCAQWKELRSSVEKEIKNRVSVHLYKDKFQDNFTQGDFAKWIKNGKRKEAIEIFTTNYDYLFEIGLEHNDVPYYDGFIGSYYPFFFPSSVEDLQFMPSITKLWKLHGSLGWSYNADLKKITRALPDDSNIMIFPSSLKYDNSKKQPYVSFMDRLSNFIKKDDGVLFVCGYSFGDQHINEVLTTALEKTSTSHVVVLFYDKVTGVEGDIIYDLDEDCEIKTLALSNSRLSVYGMTSAVIGGKYGTWKLKNHTSNDDDAVILDLYFEDNYSAEGRIPINAFTKLKSYQDSKKIWKKLKELSVIDNKGFLTKEFEENFKKYEKETHLPEKVTIISEIIEYHKSWNGEGEFKLPEFSKFVSFLRNLNSEDYIKESAKKNASR